MSERKISLGVSQKRAEKTHERLVKARLKVNAETDANESGEYQPDNILPDTSDMQKREDWLRGKAADMGFDLSDAESGVLRKQRDKLHLCLKMIAMGAADPAKFASDCLVKLGLKVDAETNAAVPDDTHLVSGVSSDPLSNPIPDPVGRPVSWQEAIANAFEAGAMDVHREWLVCEEKGWGAPRGDPEFSEAAWDYARRLAAPMQGVGVSELREALETVRLFIRGEPIEAAIVDVETMLSLGKYIDRALTTPPAKVPK